MPSARSSLIPRLEKLEAGLGAAGVVAMAVEAMRAGSLGFASKGAVGEALQASTVLAAGVAAGYLTETRIEKAGSGGPAGEAGGDAPVR